MGIQDEPMSRLKEPLVWPKTQYVREAAVDGMANRAAFELDQVEAGVDIAEAHGETVGRYRQYEQLLHGAVKLLQSVRLPISGKGADLGSGTGVAACIMSKLDEVEEILAVEISEPFVRQVMPVVFRENAAKQEKIQRVVGDFSLLQVEDETLGFITEIDAFHHSESLPATLVECWRVLRPGGAILAIDRAWPDSTPQAELEAKLDQQFPDHMKQKYNIPLSVNFTRRDWGEHEYTLGQWLDFFNAQGFDTAALLQYHPPGFNRFLLKLPAFEFSIALASMGYRLNRRKLWVYGFAPNRVTFIAVKPSGANSKR